MRLLSQWIFTFGLILTVISGLALVTNHQGFALRIFNLNFWLLSSGVVLYLWETIHEA